MNTNQIENHRNEGNEGNEKLKDVAGKVTGDESAEHTEKTKKQTGEDKTVLAELNDAPKKKDRK